MAEVSECNACKEAEVLEEPEEEIRRRSDHKKDRKVMAGEVVNVGMPWSDGQFIEKARMLKHPFDQACARDDIKMQVLKIRVTIFPPHSDL